MNNTGSDKDIKDKKNNLKKKIEIKKKQLLELINNIYHGEITFNRISERLINAIKVFIVSTRKFITDDCFTKASSIAYTAIISLIPTLTVILTFYSVFSGAGERKQELFNEITIFLLEHSIDINTVPVFSAITGLVENAGKIGGIGAVIMIFSATAMIRSLEKSLNSIWNVKKSRPFFLKIVLYWSILTLGPAMLISGTAVATKVTEFFSSPAYNSAAFTKNNDIWVVGSKGSIRSKNQKNFKFKNIKNRQIDYDNQKVFKYNKSSNLFVKTDTRIDKIELNKSTFKDIQFVGKKAWIISSDGIILTSENDGKNWSMSKWDSIKMNDIHMINSRKGFIAAENGQILTTADGGKTWERNRWEETDSDFNSISFSNRRGIITGNKGTILQTEDSGVSWKLRKIEKALRNNRILNLYDVYFADKDNIRIAGSEGLILFSNNGGKTWEAKKFKETTYYSTLFFSKSTGFVAGEKGTIISTNTAGEKWKSRELPAQRINRLISKDKLICAVGSAGMIMISQDMGKTWKGTAGKSFIAFMINFFAPFAFIWLLFLLSYTALPNTKVPFRFAATGAAFTGTVWVIFILLFIYYIKAFASGTFAIYGALASIPLFLLMVYSSCLIILFGAEVSYTLMHPDSYQNLKKVFQKDNRMQIFNAIAIIHHIYKKFETGNGSTKNKELMKLTAYESDQVDYYTDIFIDKKMITLNSQNEFIPANSSKNIRLSDLLSMISETGFDIPSATKSPVKPQMKKIFSELSLNTEKVTGEMTLHDILSKA